LINTMPEARKPLFIVPIRDRRQHRRVLTIRNCAITMLSIAVVLASISIYEARGKTAGDYGRLFARQADSPRRDLSRRVNVVREGPVADQTAADPMLVAPAIRGQLLMAPSNDVLTTSSTTNFAPRPVTASDGTTAGHGTTIVGDGSGIMVANGRSSTAKAPTLSGGIFKQH
jgi:hypothetical protein